MEDNIVVEDRYTKIIQQVLRVDSVTWGTTKQPFIVRYRGMLYGDSEAAYDQLTNSLKPLKITPLFRMDEGQHAILLLDGIISQKPSNPIVNLVLLIVTLLSVLLAGVMYSYDGPVPEGGLETIGVLLRNLSVGWPFAASMLGILLAHEFGHYLAARYHKTAVTLPFFLPFPFSYFGTMGAFIQLKEPPRNKKVLHDIGVAGPLAGLVIAIPVLLLGLYLSEVEQLPQILLPGQVFEGNSILYLAMKYMVTGKFLPEPASFGNLSPVIYWLRYFFTGLPLPTGGTDVLLHPVAWAGWAGLLVTALNLIPAGQLDGGHLIYVLLGKHARKLLPIILGLLIIMGFVWSGWWLWAALIFMLGRAHAEPLDQITQLDPNRKLIAILGLVIFVLVFTPVPLVGSY